MTKEEYYLTEEGLNKANKEHDALKRLKLAKLNNRVSSPFDPGDLDPEYFAFHNDIEFLEKRIEELEDVLRHAKIIKAPAKKEQNKVKLGATILVGIKDQEDEFKIVGTLEADPSLGKISYESPVGKALLGHKVGDIVVVETGVKTAYKIKKITYKDI